MPLTAGEIQIVIQAKTDSLIEVEMELGKLGMKFSNLTLEARAAFDAVRKDSGAAEKELTRLVKEFSGANVISQAHLMAEAVKQVGGASMLTAAQQQQVNAAVTAGIAQYKALGRDAGPELEKLAADTKKVEAATKDADKGTNTWRVSWTDLVAGLTATGILLQAVGLIKEWTVGSFTAADATQDMAARLQLSTDTIQRFAFAAEQAGVPVDTLFRSVQFLGKAVAGGGDSVVKSLEALGLRLADVKNMNADERYMAVASALLNVKDSANQAGLAATLLGRGGMEALGLINQGFVDMAAKAPVASDTAVQVLAQTADSWDAFWARQKANTQEEIAGWVILFTQGMKAASDYSAELDKLANKPPMIPAAEIARAAQTIPPALTAVTLSLEQVEQAEKDLTAQVEKSIEVNKIAAQKSKEYAAAWKELLSAGTDVHETVKGINADIVKSIKVYLEAGVAQGALADAFRLTAAQVSAVAKELAIEKKAVEQNSAIWTEYEELRVKHGGTTTEVMMAQITRWQADVTAKAQKAGTDTRAFYEALAALSKEKTAAVMVDWGVMNQYSRSQLEDTAARAKATYDAMLASSGEFSRGAIQHQREVWEAARDAAKNWQNSFEEAANAVKDKAQETARAVVDAQKTMSFTMDIKPLSPQQLAQMSNGPGTGGPDENRIWQTLRDLEIRQGATPRGLYEGVTTADQYARAQQQAYLLAQLRMWAQGKQRPPGFANGVHNFSGGQAIVGERGPELLTLPKGSSVTPNHMLGGGTNVVFGPGSVVMQNPIMSDPGSMARVAALFGNATVSAWRGKGRRMPLDVN